MGRNSKRSGKKPPRHPSPSVISPAPPPTNADWESSSAAFRKAAVSAAQSCSDSDAAAARLASRHPSSPLAHHVLGAARASLARADDAVPPLRRAAELAPLCPGISVSLAAALLYARRPGEAAAECARALAVDDPADPALYAAFRRSAVGSTPQARVAAAREQLLGVRADAKALTATGRGVLATAPPPPPLKPPCCCRHATARRGAMTTTGDDDERLQGFLAVDLADLAAHCGSASARDLADGVEFAKGTGAWAYWLCPVCDEVFLDASSFMAHVEGEYIPAIQKLQAMIPRRAPFDAAELYYSARWTAPFEFGGEDEERRSDLHKVREAFSALSKWKALPGGIVDRLVIYARNRYNKSLPYCVPSCASSLDPRELRRLAEWLDHLRGDLYRELEYVKEINSKRSKGSYDIISLDQDGSVLSLNSQRIASVNGDDSCRKVDVLSCLMFSKYIYEDAVASWCSLRRNCVHHGNEVLKRICQISDTSLKLCDMKLATKNRVHKGYSLTEEDLIDVEMLLLNNEVGYLKEKLKEVCTFDYHTVILPLIRTYIWDRLNNISPGEDLDDWDDKDASGTGYGSDVLDESFFDDKITGTENSWLSLSGSSNTLETESGSINSGVSFMPHLASEDPHFLTAILRALWHLKEFHNRFLAMPPVLPHLTVEVHCVICLLSKIFKAWDNEKDHGDNSFPCDVRTAFSEILNEHNICRKAGTNIASEVISTIFDMLHDSHDSSHPEDIATWEYKGISTSRTLDIVCIPHNLFGLAIREQKKCNCLKESCEKKEYTTFFHSIDISAIHTIEVKSLGQLMRDGDKQFQYDTDVCQCENKIERSLRSAPPIFSTVFCWTVDREVHINMSELLISIGTPLQFDIYEVMREKDYTLATAVCSVEGELLCFARQEEKWIVYGNKTVKFADTWESLLYRYQDKCLRPQILFFESAKCRCR